MGSNTFGPGARTACAIMTAIASLSVGQVSEGAVPPYSLVGTYELPASTDAFSVAPDGRVLAISGGSILLQDAVGSGSFSPFASVDPTIFDGPFGNFGASFLELSPDGSTIAIGDNNALNRVHFLDVATLPANPAQIASTAFVGNLPNTAATWSESSTLFVTGGEFGSPASVTRIDAGPLTAQTVVSNINGSPGGVTTDGTFLYTGNGFETDDTGSRTGEVRAVPLADVLSNMVTTVDFEASGTPIARALSAASLGFDHLGNMLIGGGDFLGESGFVAVVDENAISDARSGAGLAPDSAELRLIPGAPDDFTSVRFNPISEELLVTVFGSDTVYRYAIPAPGAGSGLLVGGALIARRRRRDS